MTRPVGRNGYGLTTAESGLRVEAIERTMTLLPDGDHVYPIWRRIVAANNVSGAQVHDARLAALMLAHDISHILTLNDSDFRRFQGIIAVHPRAVKIAK